MSETLTSQKRTDAWFTYLGIRADGAIPVMDLSWAVGEPEALDHASALLREHRSCDQIEVWRDGLLVATVPDRLSGGADIA